MFILKGVIVAANLSLEICDRKEASSLSHASGIDNPHQPSIEFEVFIGAGVIFLAQVSVPSERI